MTRSRELAELASAYDSGGGLGFRNRIINGDMRIDQRNAGASVTPADGQYTVDRWMSRASQASKYTVQRNASGVTPPPGFSNYLGITSLSSYSVTASDYFTQQYRVEGFNVSDFAWGTANATSVSVSFWVRSSLTGTFGGSVANGAANRCYVFTYTISAANTWEYKTVVIPGDTSGTWIQDSGIGLFLNFGFGTGSSNSGTPGSWGATYYPSATGATSVVGTNGATFYITGVQLEAGSVASPFERRDYGRELMMCQRYYEVVGNGASGTLNSGNAGTVSFTTFWKVTKRAGPTVGVGFGAVQGADIASAVTYQGGIGAGAWYFPQGVTASAEL